MKTPITRVAVVGGLALLLFPVSVAVWGSWWRFANMPTPEEWSAVSGASALVALGFAWYQIRQVDQSNRALVASNELARQVTIETIRPRVQVFLDTSLIVYRDRSTPTKVTFHIAVRNTGASPAFDVRFRVSPPFTSREMFFKPGMMGTHFDEVNRAFGGEVYFRTLAPEKTYTWFLGGAPELFEEGTGVPRRWEVEVEYSGTAALTPFRETFVLDLDVEKRLSIPTDSLVRIGKDLEVIGRQLESIRKAVRTELTLSDESVERLSLGKSASRTPAARAWRRRPWPARRR